MKLVRPLLIGFAVVAVLLALTFAIAFSSGFQTWAARKALASRPDLKGGVGNVSAGLHQVDVKDARIEQGGAVLTIPALHAELPLLSAGLSKKIFVSRLVAKGWVLDLSKATSTTASSPKKTAAIPAVPSREFSLLGTAFAAEPPAAAATTVVAATAATRAFHGIFSQLQLPIELSLDGVELEGEIILPSVSGHPPTRLTLVLRGGGLVAGREGKFNFELASAAPAGVAPVSAVGLRGTLSATMDTPHSFTRLGADAEASASGTQFPRGVKLKLDLTAARETQAESYRLSVVGEGRQLAVVQADFPLAGSAPAAAKLTGTWKLDARDADLVPFALGIELPVFAASGEGSFESDTALAEIHSTGKINVTADQLEAVRPELAVVGAVRIAATFDGAMHGEAIRVEKFSAEIAGAHPIATVRALQAFEFNPRTTDLKVADPAQDLLGVTLEAVPLAWAKPFLPDMALSGGDLKGELAASARDGGATLRAKTPLTIAGLSVAQGGKPLLREVDVSITPSADYTPHGWQASVAPLTAASGATVILKLDAKAGQVGKDQPVKATGTLSVNLPAMFEQPALGQAAQLRRGDAAIELAGSFGARQEIQAHLVVNNLEADPKLSVEKLPAITADLRADREAAGKITFGVPLVVERDGRKSDLNLTGTVAPEKSGVIFDAHVASEQLVVDDLKVFAAAFGGGTAPGEEPKNPAPGRDTAPPWAGVKGKATLALKKVVYGDSFEAANVAGTLVIDEGGVKVQGLRAAADKEGELQLNGAVSFNGKQPDPYGLTADFTAKGFDPAPLFRALNPNYPPTVEGKMNVNSKVTGSAKTLDQLAENARGKFELNSKGGVFRGLTAALPKDKVQAAQSTLALVSGFLGGSTGKVVSTLQEIFTSLSDISYDQLSVMAERDTEGNLVLSDFSLIAPEVRLGGVGHIIYSPGKPLLRQTLDMQLSLGARGTLGDSMGQLKLLKSEKDPLGYTAFFLPIKMSGSLEKTDLGDLPMRVLDFALKNSGLTDKASDFLNKIFSK